MKKNFERCRITPENIRNFEDFYIIFCGSENVSGTFGTPCSVVVRFHNRAYKHISNLLSFVLAFISILGSFDLVQSLDSFASVHCSPRHRNSFGNHCHQDDIQFQCRVHFHFFPFLLIRAHSSTINRCLVFAKVYFDNVAMFP